VAVVAGVGGGVVLLGGDHDDGKGVRPLPSAVRDGSVELHGREATLSIPVADEPSSYRIVYRVDSFTGGERSRGEDTVAIGRPFDGHTVKPRSEQWGTLGKLLVPRSSSSAAALVETGPGLAPSDVRVGPVLADLLASGRVEMREWRRIAGVGECQVLRFGGPISSGTVAPVVDAAVEYADACVSPLGMVLEELWVEGGRVQRRRLATSVVPSASVSFPTAGLPKDPLPVNRGGGSFRAVDPASAYAAPFWVLDSPPLPGARQLGRWAVVAPAQNDPKDEETKQRRLGYVADVWVDGIDVIVGEQGSTAGGVKPFELGDGARVSSPDNGLGEGEAVLDLRMSEVRFLRKSGYFVRVRGTVGVNELTVIARSLRETPGGTGLAYLDR
jgi:hypothetical protein